MLDAQCSLGDWHGAPSTRARAVSTRSGPVGRPGEVPHSTSLPSSPRYHPVQTPVPGSHGPPPCGVSIPSAKGRSPKMDVATWGYSQTEAWSPSHAFPSWGLTCSPGVCGSQQQLHLHRRFPPPGWCTASPHGPPARCPVLVHSSHYFPGGR